MRALDTKAHPDILKKFKEKKIKLQDKDNADVISAVLIRQAVKGDIQSIKIIMENTESPMPKELNLTGDMIVYIGDKHAGNL